MARPGRHSIATIGQLEMSFDLFFKMQEPMVTVIAVEGDDTAFAKKSIKQAYNEVADPTTQTEGAIQLSRVLTCVIWDRKGEA